MFGADAFSNGTVCIHRFILRYIGTGLSQCFFPGFNPINAIDFNKQGHECLQSLLISIPTFVGTKYFSVIHAPAKRIFLVNFKKPCLTYA